MHLKAVTTRIVLALLLLAVAFATPGWAATSEFQILVNRDLAIGTGCDYTPTPPGSPQGARGLEQILTATVTTGPGTAAVTSITNRACVTPATDTFGPAIAIAGATGGVGQNNGLDGFDVVEVCVPQGTFAAGPPPQARIGLISSNGTGSNDYLFTPDGGNGNQPIFLALQFTPPIPTLSEWGLILMALLLAAAAAVRLRKRPMVAGSLMLLVVLGTAGVAWAVVTDGLINDWHATNDRLATDPIGDALLGADVRALFGKVENGQVCFRIDASLDIPPPNAPPVAAADSYNVNEGGTLNEPAPGVLANDTDSEGDPLTAVLVTGPAHASSFTLNADGSFSYTHDGSETPTTDTFTYRANDGGQNSNLATVTFTINAVNDDPVAVDDAATVAEEAAATTINVLANDTDPDGGTNTITAVTQPANGTVVITNAGANLTYQPNAGYCNAPPGTTPDTFTYTLSPGGSTATVSVTVTCDDDAPTAVDDAATVAEDAPATGIDVLANDTDPDAGPISITAVTQPTNGVVVITGGGTGLTYQPNADYCNEPIPPGTADTFTYTLTPGGSVATVVMAVTCDDDSPTAVNDAATVAEEAPATGVDVLANDTDPDGGPLSIASVTQPVNGTVVITGGGTGLTYQPNANYCNAPIPPGTADTFTYTLTPGSSVGTVSVTVTCENDAPTADDDAYSVAEGGTLTQPAPGVLDGDTDLDGDPLTAVLVTGPAHATSFTLNADGSFSYTHDGSETPPTDTFTYRANDGTANSNVATVTITINGVNDAPVADNDSYIVNEGGTLTEPAPGVLAGDVDLDGDPLAAVLDSGPAHAASFTLNADGSFTYVHNGSETPATDMFTYHANDGVANSNVATVTITINAVNDGPVLDLDADDSGGTTGSDYAITFTDGDPATLIEDPADATIIDADSATLTTLTVTLTNLLDAGAEILDVDLTGADPAFTKDYDTTTDPTQGVLTITASPARPIAEFVALLRKVTYVNTSNNPDTTARIIQFVANDGASDSNIATTTVTITSINDAPTADNDAYSVAEGGTLTEPAPGVLDGDTDPDGDPLTAVLDSGPASAASFTLNADGSFTYVHNGSETTTDTFTYHVNDGTANSNVATVTITITAVNDAPTADNDAYAVNEGGTLTQPAPGVLDGDTDPEGSALTAVLDSGPAHASSFVLNPNGSFTYTHNGSETPLTDTFTYHANDGTANSNIATVTITINPVNDAPVADNDAYAVNEGGTLNQAAPGVLDGDTDAEGNALTAVLDSGPANASSFALNPDGSFSYTHNGSETLTDSFTYHANDGSANSNVATVTITINPVDDPPTAVADAATVDEDSGANAINVLANDTDPDAGPISITSVTQPTNGTVVITGGGTGLTYAPNLNYCNVPIPPGTADTFTYTLAPGGSSTTVSVMVNCINDAPVADDDAFDFIGNTELRVDNGTAPTPHALEITPSTFGVLDGDSDPVENNPLTVSSITVGACTDNTAPFTCTVAGFGTITMEANGRFSFVPEPGDGSATETFQYTLSDGQAVNSTDVGTVTLTRFERVWYVKNDAAAGGLGRSSDPFDTLTEAQTASLANDYIFVYFGDGTAADQSTGIALKNGQHLIGEHAGLSLPVNLNANGAPTNLVAPAPGSRPLLDDTVVDATEGVTATNVIPAEIVGLNLAGNVNAIDWNTNAAFAGTGTLSIRDNVIRSAAADGVDINLAGTSAVSLAFHDNVLTATGAGLDIQETGTGTLTITRFDDNVVNGNTAGTGININNAVFDATPGGGIDPVSGGVTVIGTSGNGVGGAGLAMAGMAGTLVFTDLDIVADAGAGLRVGGTGVATTNLSVGASVATVQATGGPAVDLASLTTDLQLASLTSTNSASTGVSLTTVNGTFSAGSGSAITNATGTDFTISGGTAIVTYGGIITDDVGQLVSVTGATAGTKSFTGAITDGDDGDGNGVSLTGNTGATVSFSGGLILSTSGNPAFTATGGGTVTVCDENPCNPAATGGTVNRLTTTTGTALNVANTTIGANRLEFRSIASNGAATGIVLNNTGASGGLRVAGTGAAGSGGTIQNTTSHAISLTNTRDVVLNSMNLLDPADSGVFGDELTNFTISNSLINGAGDTTVGDEAGLQFEELLGNSAIINTTVSNSFEDNIRMLPSNGVLTNLAISGSTIGPNPVGTGANGLTIVGDGTANVTLTVTGTTFTGNQATGFLTSFTDTARHDITITNSTFTGNNIGIQLSNSLSSDMDFEISTNTFLNHANHAILIVPGSTATNDADVLGTIANNIIGNGTADSGSRDGHGIRLDMRGDVDATVAVTGNTIRNTDVEGIFVEARLDNDADAEVGHLDLTLRNNNAGQPDDNSAFPFGAVYGTRVEARNTTVVCLDIAANDANNVGAFEDIRLRQRDTATFQLERFVGNGAVDTDVEAFVTGQNPLIENADATHATTFTGVANGFCENP